MSHPVPRCVLLFARSDAAEARAKGLGPRGAALFALARERLACAVAALPGVDLVVAGAAGALTPCHVLPQRGATFGARFRAAVEDARALGYREVVVVGLDVPRLDAGCLRAAFAALARGEVVLGPSPDGGVYLVGLGEADLSRLDRVRWLGRRVQADLAIAWPEATWIEARADVDGGADVKRAARGDRTWAAVLRTLWPPVLAPALAPRMVASVPSPRAHGSRGPPAV
ncbi:MAG: DUF2064 domain-containing protein [Deltaproteobacteria bacterium]|nr:DUF2064 domain-containing protein [Deltaproteobacteria bacterium]